VVALLAGVVALAIPKPQGPRPVQAPVQGEEAPVLVGQR
jgi:hypothetical protein